MSVARWLETDSLSNQNIASAAAIGAYTADADRMVVVDVSLDQVAGNGDYVIYVTRQINGAGSAYVMLPKTTCTAASGETAIAMQSGMISVRSGDVLTVYVDGLAGDTATPDTVVRFFEVAALQPTTAGRTLDVSATGEAGIDWANVGSPTTTVGLSGTTIKASTDTETDIAALPTAVEIVAAIDADPPAVNVTYSAGVALSGRLAEVTDLPSEPLDATATQAAAAAALTAYDPPTKAELDAGLLALVGGDGDTLESLSDQIDLLSGAAGSGAITFVYTLTSSVGGAAIADADVWVTSDVDGNNVLASGRTDQNGAVTFYLDAGTVYVWRQKSGWNFDNPDTEVVA